MPTIVYNRWLRIALEKVDEFFGDARRKDSSWIARALYLETDGPRWTAPAFDKCLLLALIYPIVTVFAVWAFSGHVGPAERARLAARRSSIPLSRFVARPELLFGGFLQLCVVPLRTRRGT
jgi:hypothetical protein